MHQNNFYVYTHTRIDTNEVFYVGIGKTPSTNRVHGHNTKYSRAYEKTKRHKFWKNVTNKTDYKVDIVYETSDEKAIKIKEIELISLYGRRCCDISGTLVNFQPGGERGGGPRFYGIKINQLDKNTKTIIKVWNELKDIQTETGFLKTNIIKCCRKKQLTAYGYIWEYADNRSYDYIRPTTARKKNTNRRVGIDVFTKDGVLYKSFTTQEETALYFGIHRTTLHKYLSNKHHNQHSYFIFKYKKWVEEHPEEAKELGLSQSRLNNNDEKTNLGNQNNLDTP